MYLAAWVTIELRQDTLVSLPEQGQTLVVNMHVGQVWDEIIAHQEAHQHPVIYDALQIISKCKLVLQHTQVNLYYYKSANIVVNTPFDIHQVGKCNRQCIVHGHSVTCSLNAEHTQMAYLVTTIQGKKFEIKLP